MIKSPTIASPVQGRIKRIQKVSNGLNKVIKRLDIEHRELFKELDTYHKHVVIQVMYNIQKKEPETKEVSTNN